jgi:hypothetical protein
MYKKRKFGQPCQAELNRLSNELLVEKKKTQETFLRSVLQNEGRCWTEFYKYLKRRKENRECIPATKDQNVKNFTDPIEQAKSLNPYYASLFSCERNNPQNQSTELGKPFTISVNITRNRL